VREKDQGYGGNNQETRRRLIENG